MTLKRVDFQHESNEKGINRTLKYNYCRSNLKRKKLFKKQFKTLNKKIFLGLKLTKAKKTINIPLKLLSSKFFI